MLKVLCFLEEFDFYEPLLEQEYQMERERDGGICIVSKHRCDSV